jgi:hypothetical protein
MGFGELLSDEVLSARRFADLFAGSGAVAIYVARHFSVPVLASDLQHFSAVLTGAIISRGQKLDWQDTWSAWLRRAEASMLSLIVPAATKLTERVVADFRQWCAEQGTLPITRAYGGHYFSPQQPVWLDALRITLPEREPARIVALSALIKLQANVSRLRDILHNRSSLRPQQDLSLNKPGLKTLLNTREVLSRKLPSSLPADLGKLRWRTQIMPLRN